jgi:hypothetical protein
VPASPHSPVPFRPSTMPTPMTWPRAPRASTSTAWLLPSWPSTGR